MLRFPVLAICILLPNPCFAQSVAITDAQIPTANIGQISFEPGQQELKNYLKKTGYLSDKSKFTLYRTGPSSSGGALKSIFALRFSDISNCGSIGCTQIVVTESTDGQFTLYDEFVGGDLTLRATQTKGAHDLVTSTENGQLLGRFNGTKYTWSPIKPPETSAPQPDNTLAVEIAGECIEDRAWHGYRIPPSVAAAGYGYCRTNRQANLLLFRCEKDDPKVHITMNMSTHELDDSETAVIRLGVGEQSFTLNATAYYDVMSGFVLPEIDPVSLDFELFEALENAPKTISLSINGRQKTIHSDGAAAAIKLMRETCG